MNSAMLTNKFIQYVLAIILGTLGGGIIGVLIYDYRKHRKTNKGGSADGE